MNTIRRLLMLGAAILMIAALVPISATAASHGLSVASVRPSGRLSTPTLLAGHVATAHGAAARNVRIVAVAWPRTGIIDRVADGSPVGTIVIAKGSTNQQGRFLLRADPSIDLADYTETDGSINLSVYAEGTSGRASRAVARRWDAFGTRWLKSNGRQLTASDDVGLTLAPSPRLKTDSTPTPRGISPEGSVWPCSDVAVATYNNVVVVVGEVYPGPHATADFQYQYGSSSELGIAVSVSGSYGSFSSGGTASKSSTATIDYPTKAANSKYVFQTTFQYKKFATYMPTELGECYFWNYEVRPTAFQGAVLGYNACCTPTANTCSRVATVPATLTKETANALTFTNGVSIHSYIGIDLSAKTGYSSKTKIVHKFTSPGYLCGSDASWPDAHRVVGK